MAEKLVPNDYNDDPNPGRTIHPEPMRLAEPGWAQPLTVPGVQRRERDVEDEELEHARAWLAHLEAGRIGGPPD